MPYRSVWQPVVISNTKPKFLYTQSTKLLLVKNSFSFILAIRFGYILMQSLGSTNIKYDSIKAIFYHVSFELGTEISHLATVNCTYYCCQFSSVVTSNAQFRYVVLN
jgi:hypothetical protein